MNMKIDVRRSVGCWLAGLCLLAGAPAAFAFGMGGLQVDSALGEPLDAQITLLSVSAAERNSLQARLGNQQAYADYGVKRPAIIDSINLAVQEDAAGNGRTVLHLTTQQPVSVPLLELLVIAQTDEGRAVRKYAALLSPEGMQAPAPASPDVVYHQRSSAGTGGTSATSVTVGAKQTLWSIAAGNKYADVSVQQMLVAIYRANPSAFDGSINHMKVGATLVMPAHDKVTEIDADWADGWMKSHS